MVSMQVKAVLVFLLLLSPLGLLFAFFPAISSEGLALETSVLAADIESYALRCSDFVDSEMKERFAVRDIVVSGAYRSNPAEILRVSGIRKGQWAWDVSLEGVVQKVQSLPWIKSAEARFDVMPMRILLQVAEVEPWIVARLGEESWLVSDVGELVEPLSEISNPELVLESSTLPRLSGLSGSPSTSGELPPTMFSSVNARFHYAIAQMKLLEMAQALDYAYEVIRLEDDGSLRVVAGDPQIADVLFLVRSLEEARTAARKLKLVREDLRERGEEPREIDLRFASQAIVR